MSSQQTKSFSVKSELDCYHSMNDFLAVYTNLIIKLKEIIDRKCFKLKQRIDTKSSNVS
jgi:hypothetical protein